MGLGEVLVRTGWRFPGQVTVSAQFYGSTIRRPLLGTGVQLLALFSNVLLLGALDFFQHLSRGTIHATTMCAYAATAGVAGFASGYLYKQMGGGAWMRNALFTVFFFCGPLACVWFYLNTVAMAYNSDAGTAVLDHCEHPDALGGGDDPSDHHRGYRREKPEPTV